MDKLFLNSLSNGTLNIDKLFSNEGRNEEWTQKNDLSKSRSTTFWKCCLV